MADLEKTAPGSNNDTEGIKPPPYNDAHRGSAPEDLLKHSHDADEALKAIQGHDGEPVILDEATNRRILRRIDWNLIPIMCVVYGLNYLDKTALSYASIMGLIEDIDLVGNDYQWLGSMFYFGYLVNRFESSLPTLLERKLTRGVGVGIPY